MAYWMEYGAAAPAPSRAAATYRNDAGPCPAKTTRPVRPATARTPYPRARTLSLRHRSESAATPGDASAPTMLRTRMTNPGPAGPMRW